MDPNQVFDGLLRPEERDLLATFTAPSHIQAFLDSIPYAAEPVYRCRCPLEVLRERRGHCFDGALFAAAMLRRIGHPPLIVDLLPDERDDDHVLAVYRVDGHWGALAKSNFAGLRSRQPVYRTLRELVMSYFEGYFNIEGERTLRGYTVPLNLEAFDGCNWNEPLYAIMRRLDEIRRFSVLPPGMAERLPPVDLRSYQAGLLGSDAAGLFKPTPAAR